MKRHNAIILGLAFLLMVAGYVAWCWRAFYLVPPFHYNVRFADVPEARTLVEQWRAGHTGWDRPQFDGKRAVRMLVRPWYDHRGSTIAFLDQHKEEGIVCRLVAAHARQLVILRWHKVDGSWSLESEEKRPMRKP